MNNIREKPDVDDALEHAASLVGGTLTGDRAYGWAQKSAGSPLRTSKGETVWLRVQFAEGVPTGKKLWEGELAAGSIAGVKKPLVLDHVDWTDTGIYWRATLSTLISDSPCSPTQEVSAGWLPPSSDWFRDLRTSLHELSCHETDRVACRQDLIDRRIVERFGDGIDTSIEEWVTIHGDLHWANVTCPNFNLLDWEGWGRGPKLLDLAFLNAFSLNCSAAVAAIRREFHSELACRDFQVCRLFVSAELLRMIELYSDHPGLKNALEAEAESALRRLRELDR